jgi:hypothetical protein
VQQNIIKIQTIHFLILSYIGLSDFRTLPINQQVIPPKSEINKSDSGLSKSRVRFAQSDFEDSS